VRERQGCGQGGWRGGVGRSSDHATAVDVEVDCHTYIKPDAAGHLQIDGRRRMLSRRKRVPELILTGTAASRYLPAGVPARLPSRVGADVADELVRVGAAADRPTPRGPFPYIERNRSPSELDASRRREGACNCACTSRPSSGSRSLARARWIAAGSLKNRSPSELDASRRREGACNCACTSRPSSGSRSLARACRIAAGSLMHWGRSLLCTGPVLWEGLRWRTSSASHFAALAKDSQTAESLRQGFGRCSARLTALSATKCSASRKRTHQARSTRQNTIAASDPNSTVMELIATPPALPGGGNDRRGKGNGRAL
jgi:hypothetical protein